MIENKEPIRSFSFKGPSAIQKQAALAILAARATHREEQSNEELFRVEAQKKATSTISILEKTIQLKIPSYNDTVVPGELNYYIFDIKPILIKQGISEENISDSVKAISPTELQKCHQYKEIVDLFLQKLEPVLFNEYRRSRLMSQVRDKINNIPGLEERQRLDMLKLAEAKISSLLQKGSSIEGISKKIINMVLSETAKSTSQKTFSDILPKSNDITSLN